MSFSSKGGIYKKVLVTGGSGFIGTAIKRYNPDWIYMSSKDCNLTDKDQFYEYLKDNNPDAVVHLAARVGGIKDASNNQAEFLYLNNLINLNVVHQSYRAGVNRVLSCLSTCCFPDVAASYPLVEEDILKGEPAKTNYGYAYAKRVLYLQSKYYNESYGVCYNTFAPSNVYGPNNDFNLNSSHFVSSMIRKFCEANPGDTITFWGSGKSLRQHLYVDDLAEIITLLLEKHITTLPLIVSPNENLSIQEHINICKSVVNKDVNIAFNNLLDGQHRKDASNERLLKLVDGYDFTPLRVGLQKTYNWYKKYRGVK